VISFFLGGSVVRYLKLSSNSLTSLLKKESNGTEDVHTKRILLLLVALKVQVLFILIATIGFFIYGVLNIYIAIQIEDIEDSKDTSQIIWNIYWSLIAFMLLFVQVGSSIHLYIVSATGTKPDSSIVSNDTI